MLKIGIIGAGLTGLALGRLLEQAGLSFEILEARDRIGGRIQTVYDKINTPVEMGATWFGENHLKINQLLKELELESFSQFQDGKAVFEATSMAPVQVFDLPKGQPASMRVAGGTSALIHKLANQITPEKIKLNTEITEIKTHQDHLTVHTTDGNALHFDLLVSTLPPYLLVNTIVFNPLLPKELINLANNTQTWMGTSIKFAVSYHKPFWRSQGFAGIGFSNSSIASEIHDHTDYTGQKFALKGFLVGHAIKLSALERETKVKEQLIRFFGEEAAHYITYQECLWGNEKYTMGGGTNDFLPHQFQGDSLYQKTFYNGKFKLSSTETSPWYGGYMEGAIVAAEKAFDWIHSYN